MAKKALGREGLQEDRTRITLFLPTHKSDDIRASRLVIDYLRSQRKSKSCRITGFTQSAFHNTPFFGTWWSSRKQDWVFEKVTIVVIDYEKRMDDAVLEDALSRLKKAVQDSYKRFNREQEVVWMIASPVLRFT